MIIDKALKMYKGFTIKDNVGNNTFSFDQRDHRELYVAPLKEGGVDSLSVGSKIVFSEHYGSKEINKLGLKSFRYFSKNNQHIFIFDNHNHAFFFWFWAWKNKIIEKESLLVHVDQHKDMRTPDSYLGKSLESLTFEEVFTYTNSILNVGNFIVPALRLGLFEDIVMVDNKDAFDEPLPQSYVLDLDIDIFSDEMNYISEDYKLKKIQAMIKKAKLITIATSPYFIDQDKAISYIDKLFSV
jgi:hypothetical protein